MSRIPTKTAGAFSQISDPAKVTIPAADRHSVDGSGYGTAYSFAFDELYKSMTYRLLTSASHGLVSGDVGKPLSGVEILDDTDATHYPSGLLMNVVSTNVIYVAPPGADVTLDVALLEDGNAYDIATSGRYVFWDLSVGDYVSELPADSAVTMPEVLEILTVGATTFTARVRSF